MKTNLLFLPLMLVLSLGTASARAATVVLNWTNNASPAATSVEVERGVQATPIVFAKIATIAGTLSTYTDATTVATTTYVYRVRAVGPGGNSGYSNTATITTPIAPPADPSGLSTVITVTIDIRPPVGATTIVTSTR